MKKVLIVFIVLAVAAVAVYLYVKRNSINSKEKAIEVIADYTGLGKAAYQTMGEEYLIARARAIKSGEETFSDSNGTYSTLNGKKL